MNAAQIKELKACVEKLKASPELLHDKDLAFFRSYIEGLGGKIPDLPKKKADAHSHSHAEPEHGHGHGHAHGEDCCGHDHGQADHGHVRESDSNPCAPSPFARAFYSVHICKAPASEGAHVRILSWQDHGHAHDHGHSHEHGHKDESEESEPEPDEPEPPEDPDPDLMTPDTDPPQEMGPAEGGELSDADMDKVGELKGEAAEAASNGDHAKAVAAFTKVIKLAPSPLVYAKRADSYLKMKKPNAAIRDCDKALALNPDSAKALRVRGSAYRYLGEYEKAKSDLAAGQRIDYDDSIDAIQAYVNKRCAARQAILVKKKAKEQEKAAKQAAKRRAKAQAEYEKQKAATLRAAERAAARRPRRAGEDRIAWHRAPCHPARCRANGSTRSLRERLWRRLIRRLPRPRPRPRPRVRRDSLAAQQP